jgi:hypothetical protein
MFKIGIEHEFVFADNQGQYLDADVSDYALFGAIVDTFPAFEDDDRYFMRKSLEHYPKRCYVEGFERHDPAGKTVETIPKGLEIRTLPHACVGELVEEFRATYAEMLHLTGLSGFSPVLTSNHPFKTSIALDNRLDAIESKVRSAPQLALAKSAMTTHGVHFNASLDGASEERMLDLVQKLNHYTPSLIPWSFSSPFYQGKLFKGVCARNYHRAETREMVGLIQRKGAFVLEFRGFDACGNARLLEALLLLYCGFLIDENLTGRAPHQDVGRLKRSSLSGFADPSFREEGWQVLRAAKAALGSESGPLELLESMLAENDSYAARMKRRFAETGSIIECISGQYDY